MSETQKEMALRLVPQPDQPEESWARAHSGKPDDDRYAYMNSAATSDELDATINETDDDHDEYFRTLEAEHRRRADLEKAVGVILVNGNFRLIRGGKE